MKSNMITPKKLFRYLLAFLMTAELFAQDATISLRTLQLGEGEMPVAFVRVAGEKEPVMLSWLNTQPNEPINVIQAGELILFRQTQNPKGETVMEIMNTIQLPKSAKEILLLGLGGGKDTRYIAIEDKFLNAAFDDWLAINASVNDVAILAGDDGKPVRIDPGKSLIFRPNIEQGKGVKIIGQTMRNEKLKTFLSSYWPSFPGQRTLMIFYDDGDRMRAKRIGDRFLVKEEVKEGE